MWVGGNRIMDRGDPERELCELTDEKPTIRSPEGRGARHFLTLLANGLSSKGSKA
jgi:hypothetical protein